MNLLLNIFFSFLIVSSVPVLAAKNKPQKNAQSDEVVNTVYELPVKTKNESQPTITMFMRLPNGSQNASDIKGVLALCLLANGVDDIRDRLKGNNDSRVGIGKLIQFANANRLAILAWGSHKLWNPNTSYDEQTYVVNSEMDRSFDKVADGWENGVKQFHSQYGLPLKNYLLWGYCGAAQWAHRLALRKPDYFLAIHIHIPGSFDKPTPEASKIMWCLTTGEMYEGYESSKRFYAECRKLGYPIIYKPIVGLGHQDSSKANEIGLQFFKYAITKQPNREDYDKSQKSKSSNPSHQPNEPPQPWLEDFQKPAFVGDWLNQEVFPFEQINKVPAAFQVALPTKEIANAWKD